MTRFKKSSDVRKRLLSIFSIFLSMSEQRLQRVLCFTHESGNQFRCDVDTMEEKYELLLKGKNVKFDGYRKTKYELKSRDFNKNRSKMTVLDVEIRKIVEKDERVCDREIRKLESTQGDLLKKQRMRNAQRSRSKKMATTGIDATKELSETKEIEKSLKIVTDRMTRLNEAKSKSRCIGMLCELAFWVIAYPHCPECQEELPCCNPSCNCTKTFLSIVERVGNKEMYSDDEEESELETEESKDESYYSSEYSSFDEEMVGKSQEDDDFGSSDEDYDEYDDDNDDDNESTGEEKEKIAGKRANGVVRKNGVVKIDLSA